MITGDEWVETDPEDLDWQELAAALRESASDRSWGYQAAVYLIVEQRNWLHHPEFLQAVEAGWNRHGRVSARVRWADVDMTVPASSGELRLMEDRTQFGGDTQRPAAGRPADQLRRQQPRPGSVCGADCRSGSLVTRRDTPALQQERPPVSS